MTHNKTTGQITGAVIPVPENSLSQNFHFTVMLALPTVQDHSAEGLALNVKEVFNNYGLANEMLEGIGVDGEHIKKGVKTKLLELLDIDDWTDDEKDLWIT